MSWTRLCVIKTRICPKNTFICMTTDNDGFYLDDMYDNQQWRLPCELFFKRKVLYNFSLSKVIPQKMWSNMVTPNLSMFLNLQVSCDQNKKFKLKKSRLLKCGGRFLLEWLVLAVVSFVNIFLKVPKIWIWLMSSKLPKANTSHSRKNWKPQFNI